MRQVHKTFPVDELELIFSVSNDLSHRLGSTNDHLRLYLSFWWLNQWVLLLCYSKCFITILCVYLYSIYIYISLHDCWHRPVSLFALLCFKPFSDSLSMLRLPQQDNPAVSHKMAASVIYNNLRELAEEQSTGGNGEWRASFPMR